MVKRVVVVGAGIAGIACAREIADAGVPVQVRDRGRRIGGRMAVRTLEGRAVDVGASYFTVRDQRFAAVVDDWVASGLARPWTDTFHIGAPDGLRATTTGPMRYAASGGLRSLVEDLADGLDVVHPVDVLDVTAGASAPIVDGEQTLATVLAMPAPQAHDLLDDSLLAEVPAEPSVWEPTLALVAAYESRTWSDLDAVFVADSPVLSFIADDGRRRGDGAPVLVAHSTPVLAAQHIDGPEAARGIMLDELQRVLPAASDPRVLEVRRWSLAQPARTEDEPFALMTSMLGLCGDGWHGPSRIEAAYLSGRALGQELADRLAAP